MNVIEQLRAANNALQKAQAADIKTWSRLRHTKLDLEFFLNHNIAKIEYTTLDHKPRSMVCTSNTTLIKILSRIKENDVKKAASLKSNGIRTKDLTTIDTWDLIENTRTTMSLADWTITDFISISPENILILHELIQKILKSV